MSSEGKTRFATRRAPFFGPVTKALLLTALAAGMGLAGWFAFRVSPADQDHDLAKGPGPAEISQEPIDEWRAKPGFVGSEACRQCHQEQFDSYRETLHSQALVEARPENEPPDVVFDHPQSGYRFRVTHAEGRMIHEASLVSADGSEFGQSRYPVRYRVGSGNFGRTYLIEADGFFIQSPVTWYETRRAWGMAPGYDTPHHPSFGRMVPESCLFCHAGHVERSASSDFGLRLVENAIGCERCHGPGRAHVEKEIAGRDPSAASERSLIVNPRKLPRKLAEAVCQQCHLQGDIKVLGRGVVADDFSAGSALEEYRQEYLIREPREAMRIVGHSEQLAHSACYREAQTLTCVTCHDPHAAVAREDRSEHYRSICMKCHQEGGCKLPSEERSEKAGNDCTLCHMPAAPTELPHVAFTQHQIGIHPLKAETAPERDDDRLVPLFDLASLSAGDRQRSLGLAWLQVAMRPDEGPKASSEHRLAGEKAEQLLATLPNEFVDDAVIAGQARLYYARGDLAQAETFARRVLRLAAPSSDARLAAIAPLATIAFGAQRFREAADDFVELTKLRRNASDWDFLGLSEYNSGNPEEAIGALEKARLLDPTNITTCETLAAIYHTRNDFAAENRLRDEISRLKSWAAARR